jgi:hypothetical protein
VGQIVDPHTTELADRAIAEVRAAISAGAPLLKCQLLACRFYDALKREFRETPFWDGARRGRLAAALDQCRGAARVSISPAVMLMQLQAAANMIAAEAEPPRRTARPVLSVIQGGLA